MRKKTMKQQDLSERTFRFSVRIMKMADFLPGSKATDAIAHHLVRSAASIGAGYRAACRSKSTREFISKLKNVEEETDETLYWLELIDGLNIFSPEKTKDLKTEANELLAIFAASIKTAKSNLEKTTRKKKIPEKPG